MSVSSEAEEQVDTQENATAQLRELSVSDVERRFRCARDLGHSKIPAVITTERSEREVLQQMFNIHLIREPWRDIPTAKALQRLAQEIKDAEGQEPNDSELRDLTGLSIERVRQLRYVVTLPEQWQEYIREETIPLNFFWELKKNVIDALRSNRPAILGARVRIGWRGARR